MYVHFFVACFLGTQDDRLDRMLVHGLITTQTEKQITNIIKILTELNYGNAYDMMMAELTTDDYDDAYDAIIDCITAGMTIGAQAKLKSYFVPKRSKIRSNMNAMFLIASTRIDSQCMDSVYYKEKTSYVFVLHYEHQTKKRFFLPTACFLGCVLFVFLLCLVTVVHQQKII